MVKKMLVIPLLIASMVFIIQCSKDLSYPGTDNLDAAAKSAPGGGETTAGNNLSFPVIALDGFTLTTVGDEFNVVYTGPYTGLTPEQLAIAKGDDWYAQKVIENKWQAGFLNETAPTNVTFIDWGDVIESSNPKLNKPFRIEVTLYVNIADAKMDTYPMALLANPSSPNEVQGTNMNKYDGNWATITSPVPTLIIQYLGSTVPTNLTWDDNKWIVGGFTPALIPFNFAQELNVGGKYIFGGSQGGWKPTKLGYYRLTFIPSDNIVLYGADIGNYVGENSPGAATTSGGKPEVYDEKNISYVDVKVVASGGRRN